MVLTQHPLSEQNIFSSALEKFEEIVKELTSDKSMDKSLSDIERELRENGRELLRRLFQGYVDARGDGDVGRFIMGSDEQKRTHKRQEVKRSLNSIFGSVEVKRVGYNGRGKSYIFPKDASLNLPQDSFSHELQKEVVIETAKGSYDSSIERVEHHTGVKISKRKITEIICNSVEDFDIFYDKQSSETSLEETKHVPLLILTTDGKGIVMRQESLLEETRKRAESSSHKLENRLSKGEKRNRKRMATVASVYSIDTHIRTPSDILDELNRITANAKRPKPIEKRVWASVEDSSDEVTDQLFKEGLRRDPNQEKEWVVVIDGDDRQKKRIIHKAGEHNVKPIIILDFIHVLEYLWKAARVFYDEVDADGEKWVNKTLLDILSGKTARVIMAIQAKAKWYRIKKGLSEKDEKVIATCVGYLKKNKEYLKYDQYLAKGYPIASGVIEGACRHLINDRMDITGARWSLDGSEAVLKIRSLISSGDFEEYWKFHETEEFKRNHASKFKDVNGIINDFVDLL